MHLLPPVLVLELVVFTSVFGLSPALMNGNLSTAISSPSPSLIFPTTITSAASIVSTAPNVTCPQCQIVARYGPLSMALWWDSTLKLTLDTVSVLVTQYNNTAVTHTTTIYEDVSSINYEPNGFALNNGTNAFVDGAFSVAYPTPFIGIQGFEYIFVTQQDPRCPKGLQSAVQYEDTPSECACMMEAYMDNPDLLEYAVTSQITLSSTYYELGDPHPVNNDLQIYLEGPISINNVSYSNFIGSVLGSEGFNKYRSCAFLDVGVGPPALMIPVAALTATTTSTLKSAGNYGSSPPKPGSPMTPIVPSQTNTPVTPLPVPIVDNPKPAEESSSPQSPADIPVNEPAKAGPEGPVESPSDNSDTDQPGNNGGQLAVEPSESSKNGQSNTGAQPVVGSPSNSKHGGGSNTGDTKAIDAVAISYAGTSITPDISSHYSIPEIGQLSPGGSPVTTNNVVYSLATSATALVSNGQTIYLQTFAAVIPNTNKYAAAPALTFGGSTYTVDSSSHIVVAGQTIIPGAVGIMVSSTLISLAHDASVAVVGGTTQALYSATPAAYPVMKFAGETYTANAASAFAIAGQALLPGGVITVSSTLISLAAGASFAVIADSTQSLALAPAPTEPPTFAFDGSTYTADASSDFLIGSQTLTEGGVVIVSGTPISYASGGGDIVVGTSTEAVNIGGLIMSGFGNGGANTTGPIQFTGGAIRCNGLLPLWLIWAPVGGMALMGLR